MKADQLVIVLDCGATSVRAIAVNEFGELKAAHAIKNQTHKDPFLMNGLIWDVEEIWNKLKICTQHILKQINKEHVVGITVCTFGVDGTIFNKDGKMVYPVISWACQRTAPIMENIDKYMAAEKLYAINGVNKNSFNTINKLIWFKENRPELLEKMDKYLFISSIFLHKLTGEFVTEASMAGTSMLTNCHTRQFSEDIFQAIGIENKFPKMVEAGEKIGGLIAQAAHDFGLPKNTPVFAAGHDTQFALFGAGAKENEVVLSSGTWEILMARTQNVSTHLRSFQQGISNEFDAISGLYNTGIHWLGSGILEWLTNLLYSQEKTRLTSTEFYHKIIAEASKIKQSKIKFELDFLTTQGMMSGLGLHTKREEIYRACLEALAQKTAENLQSLETALQFKAQSVIVVGGGSKNALWNQLRAQAIGKPIKLIDKKETTVLGAALFAMAGLGIYKSAEEARDQVKYHNEEIS